MRGKSHHYVSNRPYHRVIQSDFLIIGSGVAGLSLALNLAREGRVALVTKKELTDSNTNYAQGGVAAVMGIDDDPALHIADTLAAGAGLCRPEVVELVVREGPDRIRELLELGVAFTTDGGTLALGLEGGHSRKRIVHARDHTGREIETRLLDAVLDHPNIEVHPYHTAVDLIVDRHLDASTGTPGVWGAYVLDVRAGGVQPFVARRTILATGGAGKVYLYTTNPDIATGDGIAIAYRAGARIANLEFVQFHPTCLYHPRAKSFLLSEALRGEGGRLVHADGSRFMDRYDPRAELAPRDIVARAIDSELKRTGAPCVFLDVTRLAPEFIERRFPSILQHCLELDLDIRTTPIPVVPATHYFCGGVDVDTDGRTSLANLYAIGEVSHTGLHGANRLASNSLLEALVFARRTFAAARAGLDKGRALPGVRPWQEPGGSGAPDPVVLEHDWDEARRVMWDYVGIVRSDARLEIARRRMRVLSETVNGVYWRSRVTQDLLELRNIVAVGELVIESARQRRESRGLHYTESHPQRDDTGFCRDTVVQVQES
ncbi:MAG TPA: L-aspartate oxidase [Candidatus Krumholzibacteria bacterium]|nr:L-aspartate oxidase [Candidatus Krumholzibacteria bacterium]